MPPETANLDAETLRERLRAEFVSLNSRYFDGDLTLPEIVLSRRKTYGGYYQPGRHRIVLSWQAYVEHGWDETLNTFRHEVAHIVQANHSPAFWEVARRLGATRRYAASPRVSVPPRFVYACPACGLRVSRHRRLRRPTSCGVCDRHFNPCFALRLLAC